MYRGVVVVVDVVVFLSQSFRKLSRVLMPREGHSNDIAGNGGGLVREAQDFPSRFLFGETESLPGARF
jgi:hypothetical protein